MVLCSDTGVHPYKDKFPGGTNERLISEGEERTFLISSPLMLRSLFLNATDECEEMNLANTYHFVLNQHWFHVFFVFLSVSRE